MQSHPLPLTTLGVRQSPFGSKPAVTLGFEAIKLTPRRENILREQGDIAQRPGQQRGYDNLGYTRCAVLPDMPIASDARRSPSFPGLKRQAATGKMIAVMV